MVSDPWAKTAVPLHTVLAVVLQVRDGRLQVLLWERALEPVRAASGRSRAASSAASETLEQSIRRHLADEGRRPRARPPRAARDAQRPRPEPAALGARDRLPRPRPDRRRPGASRRHALAPGRRAAARLAFDHGPIVLAGRERLRAKLSYTNIGFALAPDDVHDLRAARPLPGRARPRRLGDEPPARAPAPPPARADRQPPRAGPGGRPPGRALRLPRARHSRSPTSSRCCGRRGSTAARLEAARRASTRRGARRQRDTA